jgi:hypothetical protein
VTRGAASSATPARPERLPLAWRTVVTGRQPSQNPQHPGRRPRPWLKDLAEPAEAGLEPLRPAYRRIVAVDLPGKAVAQRAATA